MPTETKKTKTKKSEIKFEPIGFSRASVMRDNKGRVVIQLPEDIGNELSLEGEVFCTLTSGVLQISSSEPQIAIPVMNLSEDFTTPRV